MMRIALTMTLVPIAAICVRASEPDLAYHARVLERLVEEARSFELPEDIEITMRQTSPAPSPSEADIDALRRLAPVDANARLRLEQMTTEIKSGGVDRTMLLMYASQDHWRINTDRTPNIVVKYSDSATNGRTKWHLTDRKLQHANHDETIEKFAIESGPWVVRLWLGNMVTGAGWPLENDPELLRAIEGPNGLLYTIRNGDAIRRITVVPGPKDELPRVTLVERKPSDIDSDFFPVARFSDWEWNETVGRHVAHRYEMITSSGAPEVTITLVAMKPLDRDMDLITALPASDGVDPFRGEATFAHVTNLSRGEMSSVDSGDRSVLDTISIRRQADSSLRVLGIVVMGAVALTVALFVRSKVKR